MRRLALVAAGFALWWLSAGLPGDDRSFSGLWSLWYLAGGLWRDGLHTKLLAWPTGAWVWPEAFLEGVVLAPITALFGPTVSWRLLVGLRLIGGALGLGWLARGLGGTAWAGLALLPAALHLSGHLEAGATLWVPLALALLHAGGAARVGLASLLFATSPLTTLAGAAAVAVLLPEKGKQAIPAFLPGLIGLILTALLRPAVEPAVGSLIGMIGLGPLAWGSPVLALLVLGVRDRLAQRGLGLAAVGALLTLGPVLQLVDAPVGLGGKQFPLPYLLIARLPPFSTLPDLTGFGVLAFVGLGVVLARLQRPWWALTMLGLVGARPTWAPPPPRLPAAPGPVATWPLERAPRAAWEQTQHGQPIAADLTGAVGFASVVEAPLWKLTALQDWLKDARFATLVVDGAANWGQGPDVAFLLGPVASVAGPQWPAVDLQGHSFQTRSTVPPLPETAGQVPARWDGVESGLEPLFDPTLFSQALTTLDLYTSPDGAQWRAAGSIAHSLTSLGLTTVGDEALLITAMVAIPQEFGPRFPRFHSSSVLAITTSDLTQWGARTYWLDQRLSIVDSQIDHTPDGLQLTTWVRTGPLGANPVALSGDHPVVVAKMGEKGLFVASPPIWSAPFLADPTPAGPYIYATQLAPGAQPRVLIATRDGQQVGELVGLTVPWVYQVEGAFRLLAHGPWPGGGLGVVEARSADGLSWSTPTPVPGFPDVRACESPVATKFKGQYVLLCSRRVGDHAWIEEAPR